MNANAATLTEPATAQTGSMVANNTPANGSFDLIVATVAGSALANSGAPYTLPISRTVEAWFNTTSATTDQAIAAYRASSPAEAFIVFISVQSTNVDCYNDYLTFPTPQPLNDGHWHT